MPHTSQPFVLLRAACCAKAGIWTNQVLHAMQLPSLPLVTSVEQQTYYATPEGNAPGGCVGLGTGLCWMDDREALRKFRPAKASPNPWSCDSLWATITGVHQIK